MKYARIRWGIFLFAAVLHGAGIWFLSFSAKSEAEPVFKPPAKSIQLVDIAEAVPPAKTEAAAAAEPPPLPAETAPAQEIPAEYLEIPAETVPFTPELAAKPVAFEPATLEPATLEPAVPVSAADRHLENEKKSETDKKRYLEKNFNYIQRRIKEKLTYPAEAKRAGMQGTVEAVFTVHPDGKVTGVSVRVSSGQILLDKAAVDAIYAAAPFRPAPPGAVKIAVPVSFKLR
jgi:protein TonB